MTDLSFVHLTFDCIADSPIQLGGYWAGNRLRGALGYILLRNTCPEDGRGTREHAKTCPACWLLSHRLDAGHARRAYSIVPPLPAPETVLAGQRFTFTITLYGDGWQYLPYFVLAVGEMGRTGVGRGTFTVASITARNPFLRQEEVLLAPGADLVSVPTLSVAWQDMPDVSSYFANASLSLAFLTPTRLTAQERLMKRPAFGVLFRRLLHRIDTLGTQFAGMPRRTEADIARLHAIADTVVLTAAETRWIELRPRSGRDRRHKPMSGFVGQATYESTDWTPLLPYLLFGQGVQVGKMATKGNGVYQVALGIDSYWLGLPFANQARFGAKNGLRMRGGNE